MEQLSKRQQEVYDYISWYNDKMGICPSIADVAEGLKLSHTTVAIYVDALKQKGCVICDYGIPRSLQIASNGVAL